MKKKIDVKKKMGGRSNQMHHIGSCPQVPVIKNGQSETQATLRTGQRPKTNKTEKTTD
jgi:hypothetical protein